MRVVFCLLLPTLANYSIIDPWQQQKFNFFSSYKNLSTAVKQWIYYCLYVCVFVYVYSCGDMFNNLPYDNSMWLSG